MSAQRIKVTIVDATGAVRETKTFKNPLKPANEILERLQASGYAGDLQDSAGDSLSGADPLNANHDYHLQLPSFEPSQGRAPLLSASGKILVEQNVFIVLIDHEAVGGGFFFRPGKAVTADHNLPASYRNGADIVVRSSEKLITMALSVRSKKYDFALLECPPEDHSSHLAVKQLHGDSTRELVGAPLTLCTFQASIQKELQDFRQGINFDLGLMPAYGCTISNQHHHLLYDVRSWAGDSGTAIVMLEGEVIGMHIEAANTLLEQLDRDKEADQQMVDVAESLDAAATSTAQAYIALLCHVFAK